MMQFDSDVGTAAGSIHMRCGGRATDWTEAPPNRGA
ncbi:hypothetical protein PF003_g14885 [Phytophthora fragariae]|nr:hypothetical protein PF003_g14885 [Phytophthora fragariae]